MTDQQQQQHPITPPPKLVRHWWTEFQRTEPGTDSLVFITTQAARWGADQELEACCEWMVEMDLAASGDIEQLRSERRPKPPSLKEQAMKQLAALRQAGALDCNVDAICRALEQLND